MKNDFMQLRSTVEKVVTQYEEVRREAKFPDEGKSSSINALAKPFLTGYFTLAIAGKMSSGKSTFINSLIGENLLPTGHFQTTCGITWIVSSDKRMMEVTYADGKTKTFLTDLPEKLHDLVAIPKEFDALPINDINNLIKGNDNINTILQKKAGIEAKTGTYSTDALWKEYVTATPKSKIAEKVVIYLPLPEEYEGWRIIDTPGIGAVGGIQEATLKLFSSSEGNNQKMVDAVVLLHKGSDNIQDESANKFAEDISKSMGNIAKGRLFFVLTHSASVDFINNKEGILERAQNLFGKKLSIPNDRINFVDSLVHRFMLDAKKSGRNFSDMEAILTPFPGWGDEWNAIISMIMPLVAKLKGDGKEFSNSTLFAELEKRARFTELNNQLNKFLNIEKQNTFDKLMNLIEKELNTNESRFRKEIEAVSNGPEGINRRIKEVEAEHRQLEEAMLKLQQKTTEGAINKIFSFVDPELQALSKKQSIQEVRAAYLQIRDKGLEAEKEYFQTLIKDFEKYAEKFENRNLAFESLDLEEIERKAQQKATTIVIDYSRAEEKLVKKGGLTSDDEYRKYYPHTKEKVDFDKKLRDFTALVISEGRTHHGAYVNGTVAKAKSFFEIARTSISEKNKSSINRLNSLRYNKDAQIKELEKQLKDIQSAKNELTNYAEL